MSNQDKIANLVGLKFDDAAADQILSKNELEQIFNKYDSRELENIFNDIDKGAMKDIVMKLKQHDETIEKSVDNIINDDEFKNSDLEPVLKDLRKELYELQIRTILIKCHKVKECAPGKGKELFTALARALTAKLKTLSTLQAEKYSFYNKTQGYQPDLESVVLGQTAPVAPSGEIAQAGKAAQEEQASRIAAEAAAAAAAPAPAPAPAAPAAPVQPGGGMDYTAKYLKYKEKYLALKNRRGY